MADGDISGSDPLKMISSGIGAVDDFVSLFRGKSKSTGSKNTKTIDTQSTTEEDVSQEKANALLTQLLGSVSGLSAVSSGQKAAGGYDSTTNMLLTNDLLARSAANVAALSSKKTTTNTGTVIDDDRATNHEKGALEWIVCTELYRQGRLNPRHYTCGAKVFAAHSDRTKQGYYIWAIPAVKHLREHPNSALSNFLAKVFAIRAEHLAAKAGRVGARRSVLGAVITSVTYWLCVILSRTVARKPIDFMKSVYPTNLEI